MNRHFSTLLALALAAMPLSCTKTGTPNEDILPEGSRPLELTVGSGPATKASAGKTAWNPGTDMIHVTLLQSSSIGPLVNSGYYRIKDSSGSTEADGTPVYWQSSAPASIQAWYWPRADFDKPIDISDQSDGFAAADVLSASVSDVKFGTKPQLNFDHALAKIRILWRDETTMPFDDTPPDESKIIRASEMKFFSGNLEICLRPNDHGTGLGLVASGKSGWIQACPDDSEPMTWEVLIPAQTISGETMKMTLHKGSEAPYESSVFIESTTFEAGKTYTYTLVNNPLNKNITIKAKIMDWKGGTQGIPTKNSWNPGRDRIHVTTGDFSWEYIELCSIGEYAVTDRQGSTEAVVPAHWKADAYSYSSNSACVGYHWPAESVDDPIDLSDQSTPEKLAAADILMGIYTDYLGRDTRQDNLKLEFNHYHAKIRIKWDHPTVSATDLESVEVRADKGTKASFTLNYNGFQYLHSVDYSEFGWIKACRNPEEETAFEALVPEGYVAIKESIRVSFKSGTQYGGQEYLITPPSKYEDVFWGGNHIYEYTISSL